MLRDLKHAYKGKIVLIAGVIGLTTIIGLSLTPSANVNAEARECHVFASSRGWYEAGRAASKEYKVPSSSECLDINVRNIKNNDSSIATSDPDKYCATFKVAMYPADTTKPVYYSASKYVCSKDPSSSSKTNGPVKVLATDVQNGTKYRVLYEVTNPKKTISYQIVD
jgi:hypothetical protein